ncbi:MAG: hypothetical protein KAS96_01605, partial [Planctomycetes bacterium]|nr:hypothetical protein [Planctomycetota bacterium]
MKRLFVLILLLVVSVVASAVTVELQAPATVGVGGIITINLYSDVAVGDFTIVSMSDNGAGGIASNAVVNGGFNNWIVSDPGRLNTGGFLVQNAIGKANFGSPLVSGILYSIDYTVAAGASGIITITASGNAAGTAIEGCSIEVIPEPMTIALLGLGGLFI